MPEYTRYDIGGAWTKKTQDGKKYLSVSLKGKGWSSDGERPVREILADTKGNFTIWPNERKVEEDHPDYKLSASVVKVAVTAPAEDEDIPF